MTISKTAAFLRRHWIIIAVMAIVFGSSLLFPAPQPPGTRGTIGNDLLYAATAFGGLLVAWGILKRRMWPLLANAAYCGILVIANVFLTAWWFVGLNALTGIASLAAWYLTREKPAWQPR